MEGSLEKKQKNEDEKDSFYERLDQVIKEYRKGRECLVVMEISMVKWEKVERKTQLGLTG